MSVCAWCGRRYVNGDIGWVSGDSGRSFCCEGHRYEYINARYGEEIAAERAKKEREEMLKGLEEQRKKDRTRWYGSEWVSHLIKCPEDAFQCDWSKLTGADCAKLFSERPKLAPTDVDWAKRFNSDDWVCLLSKQPQFADKCDWSKLDGGNWATLLVSRPNLSGNISWKEMGTKDLRLILEVQPELIDKCPLKVLSARSWALLLKKQPQLIDKCDKIGQIECDYWVALLSARPEFIERCDDLSKLSMENITALLKKQPQLLKKFTELFNVDKWVQLLLAIPSFAKDCDKWNEFSSSQLLQLLTKHPKLSKYCKWENMTKEDLVCLLSKYPSDDLGYPGRELKQLTGDAWGEIVRKQSSYLNGYVFGRLNDAWKNAVIWYHGEGMGFIDDPIDYMNAGPGAFLAEPELKKISDRYVRRKFFSVFIYFLMLRWQKAIDVAKEFKGTGLIVDTISILAGIVFRIGVLVGLTYGLGEFFRASGDTVPGLGRLIIPGLVCVVWEVFTIVCTAGPKDFKSVLIPFSIITFVMSIILLPIHGFTELVAIWLRMASMWMMTKFLLHTSKDSIIKFKGSALVYLLVGLGIGWLGSPYVYASSSKLYVGVLLCCALAFVVGRLFYLDEACEGVEAWQVWRKRRERYGQYESSKGETQWRLTLKYGLCIGALCCVRIFLMKGDLSVFW